MLNQILHVNIHRLLIQKNSFTNDYVTLSTRLEVVSSNPYEE